MIRCVYYFAPDGRLCFELFRTRLLQATVMMVDGSFVTYDPRDLCVPSRHMLELKLKMYPEFLEHVSGMLREEIGDRQSRNKRVDRILWQSYGYTMYFLSGRDVNSLSAQ